MKTKMTLNRVLSFVTTLALLVMMLHVIAHAISRSIFNVPLYGTNEIVAYWYLPFVALLGIPAAYLNQEHITVTLATDRMQTHAAMIFHIFSSCVSALVSIGFAWYGWQEAVKNAQTSLTAGVTDIAIWPAYFFVPTAFLILAGLFLRDIYQSMTKSEKSIIPSDDGPKSKHIDPVGN